MLLILANVIIGLCLLVLFTSIMINFSEVNRTRTKKEKKSIVETGTMTFFFYLLLYTFTVSNRRTDYRGQTTYLSRTNWAHLHLCRYLYECNGKIQIR